MQLIVNTSTSPPFNLAMEEYFLTIKKQDVIMLWRNAAAVIIGYNQNAIEEIDSDYVRQQQIPVIRRQSGGGAVFHDLGNVNFSVIHALGEDDFSNYAKFTEPICRFLEKLGVQAQLRGRNDLTIDGMKFSGNAQAVKNGRIMHHGTILYNANVEHLAGALKPKAVKIESKGIKSVRSRITNVADHLEDPPSADEFFRLLAEFFLNETEGLTEYQLTAEDTAAIEHLVVEKYGRWEWNFGSSPRYNMHKFGRFASGIVEVNLWVVKGKIEEIHIFGDFFGTADKEELEMKLKGLPHRQEAIMDALAEIDLEAYIHGITMAEFLDLF